MYNRIHNMTQGNPVRLIICFALPLMLGNVFQQMYIVVDTIIVGKALGLDALAAMGAAEWPSWLVLGIIQGLAQGFSIPMTHEFGAGNADGVKVVIADAFKLSVLSAILLICISQAMIFPLLRGLNTPKEIINGSLVYLRIMYAGIPITFLFNLQSAILRALGDSRTPLSALVVASLSNICFDFMLVMGFKCGIAGAAIATLSAQAIANLYCLRQIRKMKVLGEINGKRIADPITKKAMLRHGIPMALQNIMITAGSLIVQFVVNQYGVLFVAGFAAANKLYGLLEIAAISYGYAIVTYTGQNLGARRFNRIRDGYVTSFTISLITSLLITFTILLYGKDILMIFMSGNPEDVHTALDIGYRYLKIMGIFLPILYVLHVTRSTIQGMGNAFLPVAAGIAELVMRVSSVLILPYFVGSSGVFCAEVLAWLGSDMILIPGLIKTWKNRDKYVKSLDI